MTWTVWSTIQLLLPVLAAWAWLRGLSLTRIEVLAYSFGVGVAGSSLGLFLGRLGGLENEWLLALDGLVSTVFLVLGVLWYRVGGVAGWMAAQRQEPDNHRWLAVTAIALALALACALSRGVVAEHPIGTWDTWAIWSTRAAFLTHASNWRDGFGPELAATHPDYPLLLPGTLARGLVMYGEDALWLAPVVGVLFLVATAALMCGCVWRTVGPGWAALAVSLLCVPEYSRQAASALADVPLSFYLLGAAVALQRQDESSRVVLGGISCGAALWTKNEGLTVVTLLAAAFAIRRLLSRPSLTTAWVADFIVGVGPFVLVLLLFKLFVAPEGDIVSALRTPGVRAYWSDATRLEFVARQMSQGIWIWGGWSLVMPPIACVVFAAFLPKPSNASASALVPVMVAVVAQLAVFFAVYVMSPHPLAWHVQTSWPRLVVQLWPTAVWLACSSTGIRAL